MIFGLYTNWATGRGAVASVVGSVVCGLMWEFFVLGKVSIVGEFPSVLVSLAVSGILLYGISRLSENEKTQR